MAAYERSRLVTDVYRRELMALRDRTVRQVVRLWPSVDPYDIDASLLPVLAATDALLTVAQVGAVQLQDAYLSAFIASETGTAPVARYTDPSRFAGYTRDGRRTSDVLALSSVSMKAATAAGASASAVAASGLARTVRAVRTETVDAARTASLTSMATDPDVSASMRATSGEPCAACLALAGTRIPNDGELWAIHGSCSCTAEPVLRGLPNRFGPPTGAAIVGAMGAAKAAQVYGEARAESIDAGSDLAALATIEDAYEWGPMLFASPASSIQG